jgi:hypothetical protein
MDSLNQSQTLSSTSDNGSLITDIQKGSSMNTETTSTAGLGIKTLNDYQNIDKLEDRRQRNVIQGSGDER